MAAVVKGNSVAACSASNCYASAVGYAPHGAMQSGTFGALVQSYSYNPQLQVTGISALRGTTTLWSLTNAYSATQNNGNIVSQTVNATGAGGINASAAYTYDKLTRLTSSTESG